MKETLMLQYCGYIQEWEDMAVDELEAWYSRLDTKLDSSPHFVIGEE